MAQAMLNIMRSYIFILVSCLFLGVHAGVRKRVLESADQQDVAPSSSRKPKGDVKQRLSQRKDIPRSSNNAYGAFTKYVMTSWAKGTLSSKQLQQASSSAE